MWSHQAEPVTTGTATRTKPLPARSVKRSIRGRWPNTPQAKNCPAGLKPTVRERCRLTCLSHLTQNRRTQARYGTSTGKQAPKPPATRRNASWVPLCASEGSLLLLGGAKTAHTRPIWSVPALPGSQSAWSAPGASWVPLCASEGKEGGWRRGRENPPPPDKILRYRFCCSASASALPASNPAS